MTRIFTDGAEMGDISFFDAGTNCSSTAGSKASGSYGYYLYDRENAIKYFSPISELYFRGRILVSLYEANNVPVRFLSSGTTYATVTIASDGRWELKIGSTLVASSALAYDYNVYYTVEIYYKISNTVGEFTLKVDGNTVCTFSGDTNPSTSTTVDTVYFYAAYNRAIYLDDLALNDTTGAVDNSWCGPGCVTKITPNGNGSASEWTGSDEDQVDNYLLVDEYPKDSDTTYIYETASGIGNRDQHTLSGYVGTDRTITRIWAECRARKTVAQDASLKIGFDTGTSVTVDDVGDIYETYHRFVGQEYILNPDDSAAWEEADIAILEFVAEVG